MADPTIEALVDWIHNHLSDWIMWSSIEDDGEHRVDAPVDALAERLAERDARIRAEALRDAADALEPTVCRYQPGCHRADAITLRLRADRIEAGDSRDRP